MTLAASALAVISPYDLAIAAALLALNAALSIGLRLELEKSIAIAIVRAVVQLAVLGLALKLALASQSLIWAAVLGLLMTLLALHAFSAHQSWRLAGFRIEAISLALMLAMGSLASLYSATGLLRPDAATTARDLLVVLGLFLGHGLTSTAVVIDQLFTSAVRQKQEIETRLALGQSRIKALLPILRGAIGTAMLPVIAGMAGMGAVGIPDLMAGQILAGRDPFEAAMLQVKLTLVIGGATGLAVIAAGIAGVHLLTDARHRLQTDRLEKRRP
jgi:putative ABC transport system permease protein